MRFAVPFHGIAVGIVVLLAAGSAAAADPPARVGRLGYVEGAVSLHTADQSQWSPATLNYPVTTGVSFWSESDGRAEIQVGATEIRMDHATELNILRLDDTATRIEVPQGVVNVHLRVVPPGGMQVQTPRGTATLEQPGSYRIDSGHPDGDEPAGQVQVAVLEGAARIEGPRSALDVQPGESAVIAGDPVSFTLVEANSTPFDDWALARERRAEASESARYVSPETTGYEDLDANGRWTTVPEYGPVWYPSAVPGGWAPYRYGHWAFIPPWGWTWIDDARWGFAPFHYGRWAFIDGVWGWCPGAIVPRPVYAPALVAFVGGAGWGVSLAVGGAVPAVGWVPLAPREVFHPYYRTSVAYVRNVNITTVNKTEINNITNVTYAGGNATASRFANRRAATIVPAKAFTNASPVQRTTLAVPSEQLASAPMTANIGHLRPSAAARTGIAGPAGAGPAHGPDTSATISRAPVVATATSATPAASVPKAPGPAHELPRGTAAAPPNATPHRAPEATAPRARAAPESVHNEPRSSPRQGSTATPQQAPHAFAPLQHPAQSTQLRPTPQGWQRQQIPRPQAAPASRPAAAPAKPSPPQRPSEHHG